MKNIGTNFRNYSNFNINSNAKKIGLFVSTNGLSEGEYQSTTYIRFLSIFNQINPNYEICIIKIDNAQEFQLVKEDLLNDNFLFDIIIIERVAFKSNQFVRLLIEKCKLLNISIIYETDDDLINIDDTHPHYEFYQDKRLGIEYIIQNSDAVVVSTVHLKKVLMKFNENIIIIPNILTEYWNESTHNPKQDDKIRIGYMGTFSHTNDLKMIKNAILDVKKYFELKNKKIIFELIGGTPNELNWANRILFTSKERPYPNFVKFLKKTIKWDIAIAPLVQSNINFSKSNLKYLEYSALGIPGVYSEIGQYKESIINEYNGLLIKNNTSEEWTENIIKLIENKQLQNHIVKNSRKDIQENYSINQSVKLWETTLNKCIHVKR